MKVSVSKSGKLGRKLTIDVPREDVIKIETQKLKSLAKNMKMDGFRKGKVPVKLIEARYGQQARSEAISDAIRDTLFQAIADEKLDPVGSPEIQETHFEDGKDLQYVAYFEIYPEIKLKPFDKIKIEKLVAEVTDGDLNKTLNAVRKQYSTWQQAERACKSGDQVDINFTGSVKGEEFPGGKAENFVLELGAGKMIPGFEDGIEGMKPGEEKTIKVTFPKEYGEESLAGKKAEFAIKVNSVSEPILPELDEAFAQSLGITEGGIEKLKEEVRKNMTRELSHTLKDKLKHQVMDALFEQNSVDIPNTMLDLEIEHLQKQAEQRFGKQASWEELKDKSRELFQKQAERRIALGLLVHEIIKEYQLKPEPSRVRTMIEGIAEAYEKPSDMVAMFYNDKDRLSNIQSLVLEESVVDKVLETANVREKKVAFDEVIKPQDGHVHDENCSHEH